MRTHRTVYRVLYADGTEAYRGKRSAVLRFLGARSRQQSLVGLYVEWGRYEPLVERGPANWTALGPAQTYRERNAW